MENMEALAQQRERPCPVGYRTRPRKADAWLITGLFLPERLPRHHLNIGALLFRPVQAVPDIAVGREHADDFVGLRLEPVQVTPPGIVEPVCEDQVRMAALVEVTARPELDDRGAMPAAAELGAHAERVLNRARATV